jgi:hypothetical protein
MELVAYNILKSPSRQDPVESLKDLGDRRWKMGNYPSPIFHLPSSKNEKLPTVPKNLEH